MSEHETQPTHTPKRKSQDAETPPKEKTVTMTDPDIGEKVTVEHRSPAHMSLLSRRRKHKIEAGTAKPLGRKTKFAKTGLSVEDMWDKYRYWERRPSKLAEVTGGTGERHIFEAISNTIAKETGIEIHPRTIRRWYKANPIPAGHGGKAKRFKDTIEYTRFLKTARETAKEKTVRGYKRGIVFFEEYMREKYPSLVSDPDTWRPEHVIEFLKKLLVAGYTTNTLRNLLVGIRRFWEYGLRRGSHEMKRLTVRRDETAKTTPDEIDYFPTPQIKRMQDLVPVRDYAFEAIMPDGAKINKTLRSSPTHKLGYMLTIAIANSTGTRSGGLPTSSWFGERIIAKNIFEQAFKGAHGIVSIRLHNIQFIKLSDTDRIPEKLRGVEVARFTIHEKMGKTWKDIHLPPDVTKLMKKYLRQRLGFVPTTRSLRDYVEDKELAFERWRKEESLPALELAQKIKKAEIKHRAINLIGLQLLRKYKEILLFSDIKAQNLHTMIWVVIQRAEAQGKPITDQDDEPWTTKRLYKETHKFHLLRRSFVQNLINQGVPIELISYYGVGWEDLATLMKYYGKPSSRKKEAVFFSSICGEDTKEATWLKGV